MGEPNAEDAYWEPAALSVRKAPISRMLAAPILRVLKSLATRFSLSRQAAMVAFLLPRRFWYRAALLISSAHGRLIQRMGGNGALTRALMLDHWLRQLSFSGSFRIPFRVTGLEVIESPGTKLYTWTHLPLTEVPLLAMVHSTAPQPYVVADRGKIVDGDKFLVFGGGHRIPAIPADRLLLSRVTRALRAGHSVVFLSDPYLGGPISDVPLRLAARLQVPVVVQWAELQADGIMNITVQYAPVPLMRDEAAVAANLAFLQTKKQGILGALGFGT